MIDVRVMPGRAEEPAFMDFAGQAQRRFRFVDHLSPGAVVLQVTDAPVAGLFSVDRADGVTVSTWGSGDTYPYAGLDREPHLLVCSVLGLVQWRALVINPLLIEEDFLHHAPPNCLFVRQSCPRDYAILLEHPYLCPGCLEFFRCLGTEPEIEALQETLRFAVHARRQSGPLGPIHHRRLN